MTQDKPDELLALYCFYAKETKRQKTQRIWCTTSFVGHGLGWGHEKVKRVKKRLVALGLIENVKAKKEDGKFTKPYILVRFISHPSGFPTTGETGPQLLTDSKGSAYQKKPKEPKETSPVGDELLKSKWMPKEGTKEEKLARIKRPRKYPSEWDFDEFVESEGLDNIATYRSDLYHRLCVNKWHEWKERLQKWVPIRDWRKFVTALDNHIGNIF